MQGGNFLKFKDIKSHIIQIILGVILIPFAFAALGMLCGRPTVDNLISLIVGIASEIPVIEYFVDAISLFASSGFNAQKSLEFITSILNLTPLDMIGAASVGMWSGICFKFGKLIGINGIPVVQSLASVFICGLLTRYVDTFADPLAVFLLLAFSIVLNIVLTIIVSDNKVLALVWGMGCETIVGVFSCAYVALMLMISQGLIFSIGIYISIVLCLIIPIIVFLLLNQAFS